MLNGTRRLRAVRHRRFGRDGMKPIEKLRQKLLAQRRALFEQVARAADDLRWLDTNTHPETEEEAQEQSIARLLARLDERGNAELRAIDRALILIEAGAYGTCEDCGEPIPVERLEVLPAATTCSLCAEARERAPRQRRRADVEQPTVPGTAP